MRTILAVVLTALLTVACGGDDEATDEGAVDDTDQTITPTTTTTTSAPDEQATVAAVVAEITDDRYEATLTEIVGIRFTPEERAAAREVLTGMLEEAGYEVTEQPFGEGGVNLIARLPGLDPAEPVVVIGAHYDTVEGSPGADDNGSGTAGVIEIARALATAAPDAPVEIALWDLEEVGLLGSIHHVEDAVAAGREIEASIVLETMAYGCDKPGCQTPFPDIPDCLDVEPESVDVGTGIGAIVNDASVGLLDQTTAGAAAHVPDLELITATFAGVGECLPDSRRSDHVPFWDNDIPSIYFTDTANFRNPNYHQPTDTIDTLDLELATNVTRVAAAVVASAAGVPPE